MNQKEFLNNYNFKFKKKFGQNFIIDENILSNIIKYAEIDKSTLVLEIGPGAGALTNKLTKIAKKVVAYEIDESLKPILDTIDADIIYGDFLKRNIKEDLIKYEYDKLYVVANIPYYITTPILKHIIDSNISVDKIVIMVQKEVGDRLSSKPCSRDYNSLSIFVSYYFDVKKLFVVSKNVFIPKPNVDSVVIELSKKNIKYNVKDENLFFKLVRDSFSQKRKTLKNNLKNYDFEKIKPILLKNGFNEDVRAENLPIEIFIEISNNL